MSEKKDGSVEAVLKNMSGEQRERFLELSRDIRNGGDEPSINPKKRKLSESSSASSDVIVLDDSDEGEMLELLDVSSEISSGAGAGTEVKSGVKNETVEDLGGESFSESDVDYSDDSNDEWEVITIDDEDDKPRPTPKDMVCFRCPDTKKGKFKDVKKFWIHVERHKMPDHFSCPTCGRPFTKLNFCISHELRVHGTEIPFDNKKDPVMIAAKAYVQKRQQEQEEKPDTPATNETDDTDCEDVKFYRDRFNPSMGLYPYRGPKVNTMLEVYEIQYMASHPKASRAKSIAKIAVETHKENVNKGNDIYKLGRFSGKRIANVTKGKKKRSLTVKKSVGKSVKKPAPTKAAKRPRDAASECEAGKPKTKKVRYEYLSLSSSSEDENSNDSDYVPERILKSKATNDRNPAPGPSSSSSRKANDKPESSLKKKKSRNPNPVNPVLKRECVLCKYKWENENDIRSHRNTAHPKSTMQEILGFHPVKKQKPPSSKKLKLMENEEKRVEKVPTEPKKKDKKEAATKRKSNKPKQSTTSTSKSVREKSQKKGAQRKSRSQVMVRRPVVPLPDSTFSRKEEFLHYFGLVNRVRLNVHQKKAFADLGLRECSVRLRRLTDFEIAYYKSKGVSSLESYSHFLLG